METAYDAQFSKVAAEVVKCYSAAIISVSAKLEQKQEACNGLRSSFNQLLEGEKSLADSACVLRPDSFVQYKFTSRHAKYVSIINRPSLVAEI